MYKHFFQKQCAASSASECKDKNHWWRFVARPAIAIDRVIAGVRRTGARAHILHLSSAAALPALRAARAEGLPITVETCPHYLILTEEACEGYNTAAKWIERMEEDGLVGPANHVGRREIYRDKDGNPL